MAISKVKLPDNTTQEVHDYRIIGVDTSPVSGSANVITSGGVYTELASKENTANKVTSLSSSSTITQYPSAKTTYDEVHPAVGTSQPSGGMLPNMFYSFGTLGSNTTFTLASAPDANILNHYFWTFDIGSTVRTITWPSGITWKGGSAPTISANKHYEISVINNIGIFVEI